MPPQLKEDNERAGRLAGAIFGLPGIVVDPALVQTNIVFFDFKHPRLSIPEFLAKLKEKGVLALSLPGGIRFVTHKDVGDGDVDRAVEAFREILGG
jgi:threonine aldolase